MTCNGHTYERVRIVGGNGDSFVFERCDRCFIRRDGPTWISHQGLDLDLIPVIEDRRFEVPPCRRCGARGTELHHWAPRALFEDADIWPQDWLCRPCHTEWHQTMTSVLPAGGIAISS